jgi:transposase
LERSASPTAQHSPMACASLPDEPHSPAWIGLDLGEYSATWCANDAAGQVIATRTCAAETNALAASFAELANFEIRLVAVEAGCGPHLTRELADLGFPIVCLEVRQASKLLNARRNKTDKNDAFGLAEIARLGAGLVSNVLLKPREAQSLRTMIAMRQQLVQTRVRLENALRSAFRVYGVDARLGKSITGANDFVEANLSAICSAGYSAPLDLTRFASLITAIRRELAAIDCNVERLTNTIPACRRMMSAPGVGPLVALSFFSAIVDPHRFSNAANVAAYLGLTPRIRQSGVTERSGRITKMGNKMTRMHLVRAAFVLLYGPQRDSALRNWGRGLLKRNTSIKVRVAVARKLAVLLLQLWRKDCDFQPYPDQRQSDLPQGRGRPGS